MADWLPVKQLCLIVDDELAVRDLVSAVLDHARLQTLTARDAVEGIAVIENHADILNAVVCDIRMPQMTEGLELARRVRRHFPGLPILPMSGYTDEAVTGFDFLGKPFTAQQAARQIY